MAPTSQKSAIGAERESDRFASRGRMIPEFGAGGNAGMGTELVSLGPASTALRQCRKESVELRLSVMTHAEKPRRGRTARHNRPGRPNYRGQNHRFMRLSHLKNAGTWPGPSGAEFVCPGGNGAMKVGRKRTDESPATAIRTRLVAWRQEPETQRPSLRALAEELSTNHQLLSFYLKGLNTWQRVEYHRKAQEIRSKGLGMTWADEQQAIAYDRAALQLMLDDALEPTFQRLEADAKAGKLTRNELRFVNLAARRGMPRAQKIKQALAGRGLVLQ